MRKRKLTERQRELIALRALLAYANECAEDIGADALIAAIKNVREMVDKEAEGQLDKADPAFKLSGQS